MLMQQTSQIEYTLNHLFNDSKKDKIKIIKALSKSVFRPMQPVDFKDLYLSVTKTQGAFLKNLIIENKFKNIVEFGTSFGISTLYLTQGILETNGKIITTELIETKAKRAIENFKKAGVENLIEVRIGDAMQTLKGHDKPIDLLFLDGWKDLYLPLFEMLEPNFRSHTLIYVDNANMKESQVFLSTISKNKSYQMTSKFNGKVVLIHKKNNIMSDIANCPTCGAKAVIKTVNGEAIYKGVQDEEALKKVGQLKKAMQKFKDKAEALEKELAKLKPE